METKQLAIIIIFALSPLASAQTKTIQNYKTLKSIDIVQINDKGVSIHTTERVFKILNEAGRVELSINKAQFVNTYQQFKLIEAYASNGVTKNVVSENQLRTSQIRDGGTGLIDVSQVLIPMNLLQVGSEVHLKYQITSQPQIGALYSEAFGLANNELATEEYYRAESTQPLQVYQSNESDFYTLTQANVAGKYVVELRPSKKAYLLEGTQVETDVVLLSNAKDWQQINSLLSEKYQKVIEAQLPPKFQKIAESAEKLSSTKEKIEFVARSLAQLISYSGDWSTTSGMFFPQGHANVVGKGKGDCKDYSTSMVAILRKLKMKANVALTFRSQQYIGPEQIKKMAQLPSLAPFNHAIVWINDDQGKIWWVDPTNPVVIANVLSTDILGNYALVLDGKSNAASFIPERNEITSDLTIENFISLQADNSIVGKGSVAMSISNYNLIAMSERSQGKDAAKKIFSSLLNPTSKIQMELTKNVQKDTDYNFVMRASDWVHEDKGKFKSIVVMNPLVFFLEKMMPKKNGDLGDIGTTKFITHVADQSQVDSISAGCLARSPWLDADRIVENKSTEFVVTDIIRVKQRFVSKKESSSEVYEVNFDTLVNCLKNSNIVMSIDPMAKTGEMIAQEKLHDTPVELMTDADALRMQNTHNPLVSSYLMEKRYRYYSSKLLKNPKDPDTLSKRASVIAFLGFISGETYQPEYLREGIQDLDLAIAYSADKVDSEIYQKKISDLISLDRTAEASDVFKILNSKSPSDFSTYFAAYILAKKMKNLTLAEQWIRASEALIKTEAQKDLFHSSMGDMLAAQGKIMDAISHREYFVKQNPDNPWSIHNLACEYLEIREYDKAIELEKKAISLMDFGAARTVLADSYVGKAQKLLNEQSRKPASIPKADAENLLLEALKWQPRHINSLYLLAQHSMIEYAKQKDKTKLAQGKIYLDRALEQDPANPTLQSLLQQYKFVELNL